MTKKLNILPENPEEERSIGRFPSWLHRNLPRGGELAKTGTLLKKYGLNTVCEEAKCPNRFECYSNKTATFLALGKECSRSCGFCDIDFSKTPQGPEADEPRRVALSVRELGLKHAVITMVARDDLEDGGAAHIAAIVQEIRELNPGCTVEVLTSDFDGKFSSVDRVLEVEPEVFNHNIETVKRLSPRVRHKATYERTLSVLKYAHETGKCGFVKSGIMVGLGETKEEVYATIDDLKEVGCAVITIGQYLQPNRRKLLVKDFVHPDTFKEYEEYGHGIGVRYMYSGPFVRSSYNAHEITATLTQNA
ncbi:MAG: Lipoyl synthase [Chlamydiae bacterium]|nr:Lipoyl synthase [Chlamydiota bacterium]